MQTLQILASLNDPSRQGGSLDSALLADLQQAANLWAGHIAGKGVLTVDLEFQAMTGDELADGGPAVYVPAGTTLDGKALYTPSSQYEISTGTHLPGLASHGGYDINVSVNTSVLSQLYTGLDGHVPATQYDAVSLFEHEIDHGLGENGYLSPGSPAGIESMYDHYVRIAADGTAVFTGPNAELVNGGAVALTTTNVTEAYYHVANSLSDPNATDLMSGQGLAPGTAPGISQLDLAILKDSGVPITDTLVARVVPVTLAAGRSFTGTGGLNFVTAQGAATVTGAASGGVDVFAHGGLTFIGGDGSAVLVNQGGSAMAIAGGGAASSMTAFAGAGDVSYSGGAGADEIINGTGDFSGTGGHAGSLVLFGGSGTLRFSGGGETDTIVDGSGAATIAAGVGAAFAGTAGGSVLSALGAGTFLAGNAGGDRLTASAAGGDIMAAGSGNETLAGAGSAEIDIDFGGSGADQVLLGRGNDSFVGGTGAATVQAGSGNAVLYLGSGGPSTLDFAAGLTGGADTVSGFRVGTDHLHLSGYAGDATMQAAGTGTVLGLSDGTRIVLLGVSSGGTGGLLA